MTKIDKIIGKKSAKPNNKKTPTTRIKSKSPTVPPSTQEDESTPEEKPKYKRRRGKFKPLKVWSSGENPTPDSDQIANTVKIEETHIEKSETEIEDFKLVDNTGIKKTKAKPKQATYEHIDLNTDAMSTKQSGRENDVGSSFLIITGVYDELRRQNVPLLPVGCGKTLYATYLGYEFWHKYGRQVFTTYHTTFSRHVSPDEFMSLYAQHEVSHGDLFIVDEIDRWLSPQNKRGASGAMLQQCISVRRQMQIDMIGTCQRYMDVVKWTRDQVSRIFVVQKFHPPPIWSAKEGAKTTMKRNEYNTMPEQCMLESCPKKHVIIAFEINKQAPNMAPIQSVPIDTDKYGKLYDTHEIVTHSIDDLFFRLAKEQKIKNKLAGEMDVPSFSNPRSKAKKKAKAESWMV